MKVSIIKSTILIVILSLTFQSCTEDDQATTEISTEELKKEDSNQHKSNNVAALSNTIVKDWTDLLLGIERYAAGMRPNASARALAYIHLAAYETAIPGMRNHISNKNRLQGLTISTQAIPRNIDYRIAINACYGDVIDHFILNLPEDQKEKIEELEKEKEEFLSKNLPNRLIRDSKQWGEYVAEQVIEYSQTDESAEAQILEPQPLSYEPPTGNGYWTYSADPERALFPYWESVRTFVVSPDETTTIPPLEYSQNASSPYYAEMMEVYTVNNQAKEEQDEQLWIAEFWSDDVEGLMMSPPARQVSIANQLIEKYTLNLEETLTLYAKLGFALNDAAVSTWKYKYEHMVMRPSVYIKDLIDPEYQTNLFRLVYWPNPSFPGYPSGHSCFASAAGGIFINFFGDNTNFTDRSHDGRTEFLSAPRQYNSFREMARENAFSRIPLGVHIRMDCAEGLRLGYEISDAVNDLDLDRKPG